MLQQNKLNTINSLKQYSILLFLITNSTLQGLLLSSLGQLLIVHRLSEPTKMALSHRSLTLA